MPKWIVFCVCLNGMFGFAQQRYIDDVFGRVDRQTFTYAVKEGEELQFDFYEPRRDSHKARPILVWMHGGGFSGGERDNLHEVKLMKSFARKGYVAVSISYRLLRKGEPTGFGCDCPRSEKLRVFREAAKDYWDAVYYLWSRADSFRLDRSRFIFGGSSAGAEGILNAAYLRDWVFEGPTKYDAIQPAAVFALAGAVVDARYLTADRAVPAILFHGNIDPLVPFGTSPHHFCPPDRVGFIWLDGSETLIQRLATHDTSFFNYVKLGGGHEIAGIPFKELERVFAFLESVVMQGKFVQWSFQE